MACLSANAALPRYGLAYKPGRTLALAADEPRSRKPRKTLKSEAEDGPRKPRRSRKKAEDSSSAASVGRQEAAVVSKQEQEGAVKKQEQEEGVKKQDKRWTKAFPWLGREFEETFVRPRNEPNPLVCCFGEATPEFIPSVRVCPVQMDPDAYSSWKGLQWTCPEFARSPGTTAANVAISVARLAGKAAFVGKVGDDELGRHVLATLRSNNVETRGVKVDAAVSTSVSRVQLLRQGKSQICSSCVQQSAESCLDASEVDVDMLKEARLFHFSSLSLTAEPMASTLMWAIQTARSFDSVVFFDVNLPLPFWTSRDATWSAIEKAWRQSDVIKINKVELEYLIGDEGLAVREVAMDHLAKSWQEFKRRRNNRCEYHYTREQIAPIWTDNIKLLFVTDGTYRIHYYSPKFHGEVQGTEDVIVAAQTCDRTGSGDTISAAMIRKLVAQPHVFEDQDKLERALRFAIAAGVISQWTVGAVRGFPTESAAQNLTEQMFPLAQI